MDDYLAMLSRRARVILIPVLVTTLLGYLAYLVVDRFFAKYTSQSVVLVEAQKVPEKMVQPVVSDDLQERINMLVAQASSESEMGPMLARLFPGKTVKEREDILADLRRQSQSTLVSPPFSDLSQITGSTLKKKAGQTQSPGFMVSYTAPNALEAKQICEALTSKIIEKNLQFIQANAKGTVDVLTQGLDNAKSNLDVMDSKLAVFKKQYVGQLPGDQENNLKILMGLSSQLDANTQRLNQAQQDKAYAASVLSQQVATWKSSQGTNSPETLEKQLSGLQSQLLDLQARYTEDHPDVIKTKADIAEVKKKLAEINKEAANGGDPDTAKASAAEPAEIRQLRLQMHQYDDGISAYSREEKRLQQEIAAYQGRISLSPAVEEQYKVLTRDYDNANKTYQELLANKSAADLTANMTNQAQGERMSEIQAASMPESPSFPNLFYFLGGGLGAGLALGFGLAMWLELRDKSIRTEADAEAALELPILVAVPWVGVVATEANKNGKAKFWKRKSGDEDKLTVEV